MSMTISEIWDNLPIDKKLEFFLINYPFDCLLNKLVFMKSCNKPFVELSQITQNIIALEVNKGVYNGYTGKI